MGCELVKLLTTIIIFMVICSISKCMINTDIQQLNYSTNYKFNVNKSIEYILEFSSDEQLKYPPRVSISTENGDIDAPLMVVARQPKQLLSWQLPSMSQQLRISKTSRTLCQDILNSTTQLSSDYQQNNPIMSISTSSEWNVSFDVNVDYQKDFYVKPNVETVFKISPTEPRYYYYNFTANITKAQQNSNYDTVILEVISDSNICMTVGIQNVTCPVFDMDEDITFRGFYETVNTKGGITIPKYKFPNGFYVVFVAKTDDSDCESTNVLQKAIREKNITLIIKPSITYDDYVNAVFATLGSIAGFYLIFVLGFFFCTRKTYIPRQMEYVSDLATPSTAEIDNNSSMDGSDYDTVSEADTNREIRLGKSAIHLSDLARTRPKILQYKSYLYLYNVLTVALFYGLPVVQLVITYQRVLNETGQQDLCYYNFLCAHPIGVISDFNHVFSNIGYFALGVLFVWITYRREITHKDLDFDRQYGIPQHYGMFYAMGVALMMEGVLSASYHVCPNLANFQFDSSFMYVMAVLCMVKLYQNRHPDINATACATFGVLAVSIFLGLIGILDGKLFFWIGFTVIHIITCLYLSAQIYYMGCWKLDHLVFIRIYRAFLNDYRAGPVNVLIPLHKARMCLLIIGNLCNWAMAAFGIYQHKSDFAFYLLMVFMSNTVLYFVFYIVMKYLHKERVNKLAWFFLAMSMLCAISAMWFFLHKSISWQKSPAESRQYNQECKLLRFYDYHDIWHFLSAIGMFFTFMVLLTLDDDLSHTHRTQIPVF